MVRARARATIHTHTPHAHPPLIDHSAATRVHSPADGAAAADNGSKPAPQGGDVGTGIYEEWKGKVGDRVVLRPAVKEKNGLKACVCFRGAGLPS